MKISWGWKIMALYVGFVIMMVGLVVASSRQKIDLVSNDYYKDEIAYQGVLDASRNQANLAGDISVHANENDIIIDFPDEFSKVGLKGNVNLYAASNQDWDRNFTINTDNNSFAISRSHLQHTMYTIKISYIANGKKFYYETQINLHVS